MLALQSHQEVLGCLGRALSLELSAVQQYTSQAQMGAAWGLRKPAASLGKEVEEELQHTDRIIERVLAFGARTNG